MKFGYQPFTLQERPMLKLISCLECSMTTMYGNLTDMCFKILFLYFLIWKLTFLPVVLTSNCPSISWRPEHLHIIGKLNCSMHFLLLAWSPNARKKYLRTKPQGYSLFHSGQRKPGFLNCYKCFSTSLGSWVHASSSFSIQHSWHHTHWPPLCDWWFVLSQASLRNRWTFSRGYWHHHVILEDRDQETICHIHTEMGRLLSSKGNCLLYTNTEPSTVIPSTTVSTRSELFHNTHSAFCPIKFPNHARPACFWNKPSCGTVYERYFRAT